MDIRIDKVGQGPGACKWEREEGGPFLISTFRSLWVLNSMVISILKPSINIYWSASREVIGNALRFGLLLITMLQDLVYVLLMEPAGFGASSLQNLDLWGGVYSHPSDCPPIYGSKFRSYSGAFWSLRISLHPTILGGFGNMCLHDPNLLPNLGGSLLSLLPLSFTF